MGRVGSRRGLCLGLVYKKGKFSATEEAQLVAAIERYRVVSAQNSQRP